MKKNARPGLHRFLPALVAGLVSWFMPAVVAAQTIDAGTTISVRTNERIEAKDADGNVYTGTIESDVMGRNGRVAIPRGSEAELITRQVSNNEIALDLDTVMVNGQRYLLETEENVVESQKDGIGMNKRTGKYVGGGALIGAIIGGIAGGGKGAAIGAGVGAAAGAGTQVLTRGRSISVPSESVLTFRMEQPLTLSRAPAGFNRNGRFQRQGAYNGSSSNYGYGSTTMQPSITISRDNYVRWQAPATARVFVQVDNQRPRLFAEGASGEQAANWISSGHLYVFTMRDQNGSEIARQQLDLRGYSTSGR